MHAPLLMLVLLHAQPDAPAPAPAETPATAPVDANAPGALGNDTPSDAELAAAKAPESSVLGEDAKRNPAKTAQTLGTAALVTTGIAAAGMASLVWGLSAIALGGVPTLTGFLLTSRAVNRKELPAPEGPLLLGVGILWMFSGLIGIGGTVAALLGTERLWKTSYILKPSMVHELLPGSITFQRLDDIVGIGLVCAVVCLGGVLLLVGTGYLAAVGAFVGLFGR